MDIIRGVWELERPNDRTDIRDVTAEAGQPMLVAESGAKRSKACLRYDLIPVEFVRRIAKRYTDGAVKYGEWNWQKGLRDKPYIAQFKAHIIEHWLEFMEHGNEKDDNLAGMAWGIAALMEVERVGREKNEYDAVNGIIAGGCEPGDGAGGAAPRATDAEQRPSHGYSVGRSWGDGKGGGKHRKGRKVRAKVRRHKARSKKRTS